MPTPILQHKNKDLINQNLELVDRTKELELILMQKLGERDFAQMKIMLFLTMMEEGYPVSEEFICTYCNMSEGGYRAARKRLEDKGFLTLQPGQQIIVNYDNIYSDIKQYTELLHINAQKEFKYSINNSKGENTIQFLLELNEINYIAQYTNNTCIFSNTGRKALFDFYLPDYNTIIEFDGVQHFTSTTGWNTEENFKKTQQRDQIKNEWCKNNNIILIRIPYTHLNKICLADLLPETSSFIYTTQENYLKLL